MSAIRALDCELDAGADPLHEVVRAFSATSGKTLSGTASSRRHGVWRAPFAT